MPKLTLHPLSVLAGAAIVGLVFLTSSQALTPVGGYRIEYLPHPRDMVQIKEGVPYTVPAGKIFVLTALGGSGYGPRVLRVDGIEESLGGFYNSATYSGVVPGNSVVEVPIGFTARAGSIVDVGNGSTGGAGRAWGYLASQ